MNKTTSDPGTPIFGQLNDELGELPEITIHDFDWHEFDFPTDVEAAEEAAGSKPKTRTKRNKASKTSEAEAAQSASDEESTDEDTQSAAANTSGSKSGESTGGRRRKEP